MKLIIAGGGTGGHLYPGIAVADSLRAMGVEILFLVSDRGLEKKVLEPLGYDFVEQDVSGFRGVSLGAKFTAVNKLRKAVETASKHIRKGDKVLLLGGFGAAPAAVAGTFKGNDVYIHEQDSMLGTVNKMAAPFARRIFLSYPETIGAPARSLCVGYPLRAEFYDRSVKPVNQRKLLVLGGSGGARILNNTIAQIADKLAGEGFTIKHMTGMKLFDETREAYEEHSLDAIDNGIVELVPYIDKIAEAYEQADIVVARAGSGTVFETLYSRRSAIYVPFAQAIGNHQYYNALNIRAQGCAEIIKEAELGPARMLEEILRMDGSISDYWQRLEQIKTQDAVGLMVKHMIGG